MYYVFPDTNITIILFPRWTNIIGNKYMLTMSQAQGAWISFPPPPFSLLPPPLFFKIFIIIRFSSFDNISRRHTSWIIRVFYCISRKTVDTEYTYYSWCMTSTDIVKWRKTNDYENFEKRIIYMKFWKKGGSREKGGGGNEIHAPCACGQCDKQFHKFYMLFIYQIKGDFWW